MTSLFGDELDLEQQARELREQREAEKRAFAAKLDHSSLAALALSAVEVKKAEEAAADAARRERQAALRAEWARRYLEQRSAAMTKAFGEQLGLPADSPLLAEVKWRFDPDDLAAATFTQDEDGTIDAETNGRGRHLDPITDVDVLTIRATPTVKRDGQVTAVSFVIVNGAGFEGMRGVVDLGYAIIRERQRAAERQEETR